jgi:ABC-type glycerol-3-phosphate transport system permease component
MLAQCIPVLSSTFFIGFLHRFSKWIFAMVFFKAPPHILLANSLFYKIAELHAMCIFSVILARYIFIVPPIIFLWFRKHQHIIQKIFVLNKCVILGK